MNTKPGRNDPCPCGSGKKFKKCCEGKVAALPKQTAPTQADIDHLAALFNAGHYAALENGAATLTQYYPRSGLAWKILGTALQHQGKDAVPAFRQAVKLLPRDPDAYNSLGNALHDAGQLNDAVASYRRALTLNPDLVEIYSNLANTLYDLGKLDEAVESCRRVIKLKPGFVEAHINLGNALHALGRLDEAAASYRRALELNAGAAVIHNNLGNVLRDLGQAEEAATSYRRALEINPGFAEAHNNLGNALNDLGQLDEAVASYRRALELDPTYASAYGNLGEALVTLGQMDEAEEMLTEAIRLAPAKSAPFATLLSHIPYRRDDHRFAALDALYERRESLPPDERIRISFAMGKAMEDIGQYDEAFRAYDEGNRLQFSLLSYDETREERYLEMVRTHFTGAWFETCTAIATSLPAAQEERIPIFIVGMPRSGTTLLEQILSSHAAVYGAGELKTAPALISSIGIPTPDTADCESYLVQLRALGQEYLDTVWQQAPETRYITDKLPGNYRHLGLIHLMLPNAKIIHVTRDPMDTCFSCYALRFSDGHEYSYDLAALGRHYKRYRKLMDHWRSVLPPDSILDVSYEDTVADIEGETRRMLDYVGLPWDPACLNFHQNKRSVRTASVMQVRQPLYSSSVARWKRFEKHLAPLLGALAGDPTERP